MTDMGFGRRPKKQFLGDDIPREKKWENTVDG